ncbi:MAG TPA: glycosyl transferase family 1 [Myxococcales bacterium]|nr:glycosyl transferase family 1 [Myxococcales bacterium]
MLQIIDPLPGKPLKLSHYAAEARFSSTVRDLRAEAGLIAPKLRGTVWMVNSTAQGGGVAEMLPGVVGLLRELGIPTKWAVIGADKPEFFALTKRLHNMLHGDASGAIDLGPAEAQLLEEVGRRNADELAGQLGPNDVLLVHDPQPVALGALLARERGLKALWRCHIGLDERTDSTRAAWRFLRPFLQGYHHAAFSAPEYIPSYLAGKSTIIYPALDPYSHKNRELSVPKIVGILCNAGLQTAHEPVPTRAFAQPAKRLCADGKFRAPGELGLLFRPIVLQVSRWDKLKGWKPLVDAFVRLKAKAGNGEASKLAPRNRRRLELCRLVLAGPDPSGVTDDPEGKEVFNELCRTWLELPPEIQQDIALLSLPMASRKENALVVNALQRCASIVVQNSLREGFGLTVTEAMWKGKAVLGSSAVGIRQQIRDRIDGRLVADPSDPEEIASRLFEMIVSPHQRHRLGRNAQRRVHDEFLVFSQLSRYLRFIARATEEKR